MPSEGGRKSPRIPEGIPRLLRDLIHDRTGIFFEDSRTNQLMEKLEPLVRNRGCESFLEYYYLLKDNDSEEWNSVWETLSVQETYFWREMSQIHVFAQIVIPEWFHKRRSPLRVWSAACATGEEPYSIAIAIAEAGFGALPIEIVGSDASQAALVHARTGIYREKSFRTLPITLRQKYFEPVDRGWRLSQEIMGRVVFKRVNLFEPAEVAAEARAAVIFCRNVFIYFSPFAIRQTVAMMASKMPPGGYLFVGASESLLRKTTDYELKEVGDALAYVRT